MGVSCGNDAESPSKGADFISGTPGMVCFFLHCMICSEGHFASTWHKPHLRTQSGHDMARVCELMRAGLKGLS